MTWVALLTKPLTAPAVGKEGVWGSVSAVIALAAPVTAGSVPAAVGWLVGIAQAAGCEPPAWPWMTWMALRMMPLTVPDAGEDGVRAAGPAPDAVFTAAGVLGTGVLGAGVPVLFAAAWLAWGAGCEPPAWPWMAWVALWMVPLMVPDAGEDGVRAAGPVPVVGEDGVRAAGPVPVAVFADADAAPDAAFAAAGVLGTGVPVLFAVAWLAWAEVPVSLAVAWLAETGWVADRGLLDEPCLAEAWIADPLAEPLVA